MFRIDPEFEKLLRPLPKGVFEGLERDILAQGCHTPLKIWLEENILIDGHNRYKICTKHQIQYDISTLSFKSREEVEDWIIDRQKHSRNLNKFQEAEIAWKRRDKIVAKAEANKKAGLRLKSNEGSIDTLQELADNAGIKRDMMYKVSVILKAADAHPDDESLKNLIQALDDGDGDVSIHSVYETVKETKEPKRAKKTTPATRTTTELAPDTQSNGSESSTLRYTLHSEAKPVQKSNEVPPEQASPVQQGNDEQPRQISDALRRAKMEARLATKALPSRSLDRQVDAKLCALEDNARTFSKPEDLSYFYEVINQWVKQKKEELLDALGY